MLDEPELSYPIVGEEEANELESIHEKAFRAINF